MNREQIKQLLLELFGKFSAQIQFVPALFGELFSLLKGSGYESKFLKLFAVRLQSLVEYGYQVCQQKEFENIGDGIFSMHLAGEGFNIRILFGFLPDKTPTLLLAFYERSGKRKTNYSSYLPVAAQRLKEVLSNNE